MNNDNRNDKSKTQANPQANTQAGKDSAHQGKDARPVSDTRTPSQQAAGKDAKGTQSPSKS